MAMSLPIEEELAIDAKTVGVLEGTEDLTAKKHAGYWDKKLAAKKKLDKRQVLGHCSGLFSLLLAPVLSPPTLPLRYLNYRWGGVGGSAKPGFVGKAQQKTKPTNQQNLKTWVQPPEPTFLKQRTNYIKCVCVHTHQSIN